MKYWDFFIDSMRLLRSRRSSQTTRIDISSLNFIYKYNFRQAEFHSITLDFNQSSMPHSGTSDADCFRMAVNAVEQLRVYWLPRYLSQNSLPSSLQRKHRRSVSNSKPMDTAISRSSSKTSMEIPSIDLPKRPSNVTGDHFVKHTIGNISYLDYNPQEYLHIQSSDQNDSEQDIDPFDQLDETNQTEKDFKPSIEEILPSYSNRSLEDYANDNNLELFYRIFVSDFLAGFPFLQYISNTRAKADDVSYETCLRFITDAEILFSIPFGNIRERIARQFILK